MITDIFLDQKRVNICEYAVNMAPPDSFAKMPPEWVLERKGSGGDGAKFEWKSSKVNTRAVSRGQNELIGKFKMQQVM